MGRQEIQIGLAERMICIGDCRIILAMNAWDSTATVLSAQIIYTGVKNVKKSTAVIVYNRKGAYVKQATAMHAM